MKKLIVAFAVMILGALPAQAQYQDLIDIKVSQLVQIHQQVVNSNLAPATKAQALDQLEGNLILLTEHRDEVSLAKLQSLEGQINQINAQLAAQILASKKQNMINKLNGLARVIQAQKAEGKDVSALESLWRDMYGKLQGL